MEPRSASLRFLFGLLSIAAGAWLLFAYLGENTGVESTADEPSPLGGASDAPASPAYMSVPAPDSGSVERPFRGRLIDAATGDPVGSVRLVAGSAEATTDATGRFLAQGPLAPEVDEIQVFDDAHGTRVRTIARSTLESTSEGWLARIAIGPTYRLDLANVTQGELADWRARLVEIRSDGRETAGDFLALHAGNPPFLRYDDPWDPNEAGSGFRIEVRNVLGTRAGSSERLGSARGVFPGRVFVRPDREFARLTGRVLDLLGNPVPGALVAAVSPRAQDAGNGAWPAAETGEGGRFVLGGLVPDLYDILVRSPRGTRSVSRRLFLPPGEVPLDDFALDIEAGAWTLRGRLEGRSGDLQGEFLLRLRSADGRSTPILARCSAPRFAIEDLPEGEYEATVLDGDGFAWTPEALRAGPPEEELVFLREDDVPLSDLALGPRDAATDAAIEEFQVQLQIGARWESASLSVLRDEPFARVPDGAPFRFTVWADGYRTAYGGDEDFSANAALRTASPRLERGFSARFQMKDFGPGFDPEDPQGSVAVLARPGVAGAELWIDGELAARSDENGIVLLELAQEPAEIVCSAPGWHLAGSDHLRGGRLSANARDVVVWFVRD